jgi:hypothetical protein
MISGVTSLFDDMVIDEAGMIVQNYTPVNEVLFTTTRWFSGLLAVLGLVVND